MIEVLVAVDGSPHAERALDWALATAGRHAVPLRVLHVDRDGEHTPDHGDVLAREARARRGASDDGPDQVTGSCVHIVGRSVARTVLEQRGDADLLVVGMRGRGGFTGLVLGSVSHQLAAYAPVPVAVVPDVADTGDGGDGSSGGDRPLVVGVDGTTGAGAALAWALDVAAAAQRRLVAVHAYRSILESSPRDSVAGLSRSAVAAMEQRAHDVATQTLESVVRAAKAGRVDVDVELVVEEGSPNEVLAAHAARTGSELAVGRHGEVGAMSRLGSISQRCIRAARGPVVVVPQDS